MFATAFRYIEAAEFLSDHPKSGGKSADASRAMCDSALETVPAVCEAVDGGNDVGGRVTDGDATVKMKQSGDDRIRKRTKWIKTKKREGIEDRQETEVASILSEIKDEMRRSTDVMQTVADEQAQGRMFDKNVTLLQVIPPESGQ